MIKMLEWDSSFLNLKTGQIDEGYSSAAELSNYDLLYVLDGTVPLGFEKSYEETKVVYEKVIENFETVDPSIVSVKNDYQDRSALYELAYESGKFSRFMMDSRIGLEKFQEMYRLWVDNALDRTYATDIFVHKIDGMLSGFVTYQADLEFGSIGLIGVSPYFQGQGIGTKLISQVEIELSKMNITRLRIPTQLHNVQACRFYEKIGCAVIKSSRVEHYWRLFPRQ